MINYIWLALILIGVLTAIFQGNVQVVTDAAIESANSAVELSIGLVGIMTLWLGLMRLAEKSGIVNLISKLLKPILKRLFPEVPENHPAMGSMVMNMAANLLGLGNAATPLGIKAMKELQELNEDKTTATNSMCMFLAINTSSITLIASTVIAYRASAGSNNPAEIIGPTIIASVFGTIVAIIAARLLEKFPLKRR
ncbi:MAG: nucleoside recognition protein [Firmicutes bacterium]|nr:nucleoside recognition protein [Bacillota bacterium]